LWHGRRFHLLVPRNEHSSDCSIIMSQHIRKLHTKYEDRSKQTLHNKWCTTMGKSKKKQFLVDPRRNDTKS